MLHPEWRSREEIGVEPHDDDSKCEGRGMQGETAGPRPRGGGVLGVAITVYNKEGMGRTVTTTTTPTDEH